MRGVVNIGAHFVREDEFACKYSSPTIVDCLCEEILSVLFGTAGAKKNIFASQIKRRKRVSPLRRRRGLRALDLRKLLKKFDQNF